MMLLASPTTTTMVACPEGWATVASYGDGGGVCASPWVVDAVFAGVIGLALLVLFAAASVVGSWRK